MHKNHNTIGLVAHFDQEPITKESLEERLGPIGYFVCSCGKVYPCHFAYKGKDHVECECGQMADWTNKNPKVV